MSGYLLNEMAKDKDWKHIADIVEVFLQGEGVGNSKIIPIAAYAPDSPVKMKKDSIDFGGLDSSIASNSYLHLSTLVEKSGKYEVQQKTFLATQRGETEILSNKEVFSKSQPKEMADYFRVPTAHFEKCPHVRVITFKDTEMEEEEFKDIIELWRTQPRQT